MAVTTLFRSLILLFSSLVWTTQALVDTKLTGTWSSKSRQVITGSGFYDPVADAFQEPPLPGISYSFTEDGHYEEAYYRALPNPTQPNCPKAIMQWQHGTYSVQPNGSLVLTPIQSDGRQLMSDPCAGHYSSYTHYNQSELFQFFGGVQSYRIYTDKFHGVLRLDLVQFDGAPMQPLYILYRPPAMLPTTTLHPTTAKATGKAKRETLMEGKGKQGSSTTWLTDPVAIERWWWFGIISTSVGGIVLWCS
ncbi:Protein rot1 [Talaromyces atroroseus]|uniref:Protein ROT1 n=1 Tax=Talaromyces atroroseus TaxID=1441469 RepID=A0A225AQB3_TALAT|nr:Protein rot1 [Talaromyces atroroseus]OKL57126.1 Protein rot1 [Talaromyces atroroseus]